MSKPAKYVNISKISESLDQNAIRKCTCCNEYFNTTFEVLYFHFDNCRFKRAVKILSSVKVYKFQKN